MDTPDNQNQFELFPVTADNRRVRYARAFSRINIFDASTQEAKKRIHIRRNFGFDGGVLVQLGPALTVRDEDILIGVIQLCNRYQLEDDAEVNDIMTLVNRQNSLSSARLMRQLVYQGEPVEKVEKDKDGELHLDHESIASVLKLNVSVSGSITYYRLCEYLGISWSSRVKLQIRDALERLSETMIALHTEDRTHSPTPLIKVDFFEGDGRFVVEYGVELKNLLSDYILIDLELRSQLNGIGKGLHKVLVSHGFPDTDQAVVFTTKDLSSALPGFRSFQNAMKQLMNRNSSDPGPLHLMKRNKFLGSWEISGSGIKGDPFYFTVFPYSTIEGRDTE